MNPAKRKTTGSCTLEARWWLPGGRGSLWPGSLPQKFSWNPVRDYMAVGGPRPKVSQNTFSILLLLAFIGSIIMFNCCGEERDVTKWNHFVWTPFHFLGNFKITSFFAKFNYLAEFDIYSYSNINIPAMDWYIDLNRNTISGVSSIYQGIMKYSIQTQEKILHNNGLDNNDQEKFPTSLKLCLEVRVLKLIIRLAGNGLAW